MDSKSLMIGDWVMRKDTQKPYKIKAIRSDKYCSNNDNFIATDAAEDWSSMSYYEPIPLTAEILKKNGFEQDYSFDECVADGCFVEVKGWSYHAENILIQWDGISCNITNDLGLLCDEIKLNAWCSNGVYVHELQHALHLCGLNDLADNLKV